MNWHTLDSAAQVETILQRSYQVPCLIFKHSTRCALSSMIKRRLESDWDFPDNQIEPYFLDVIANREISGLVSSQLSVHHETPQIILVKDGECILDDSHMAIDLEEIKKQLNYGNIFRN